LVLIFVGFALTVFDAKVSIEHNPNSTASRSFKFNKLPSPVKDDAGAKAKLGLVDGEIDPNGADLTALTDGLLPTDEDEPSANFFFNAGSSGGRFSMDLGKVIDVAQVNTYSWHPNTRGPQLYKLYGSDGLDPKFNGGPKHGVDPVTCGWQFIATVSTLPKDGDEGGQYAVSVAEPNGNLGKYRYLLFDCYVTEMNDDFGNTFYSEVDVVAGTPGK
jgi:hypothetical protein